MELQDGRSRFADLMAKDAASSPVKAPSMAQLKRKASEAHSGGTKQWIRQSTSLRASYAPRKKAGFRPALKDAGIPVSPAFYRACDYSTQPQGQAAQDGLGLVLVLSPRKTIG
ncbi:hypothetical protein FN846DRAFT_903170 [Sphaerosporella brunnea]|uniref:Uncharacterized protein n=1 Tax=Sphaerosporella brunnea TaxID=1250544 RepID=A0A5J5F893_9PEZI|nr:hypothetical protein FN846DRAFT_903170 [Sphaerosporella brunnea]